MFLFFLLFCYILIGMSLSIKITHHIKQEKLKGKRHLTMLFLFNIINFYLIFDLLTVSPETSSGNGNLFFPYLFLSLLPFILFCLVLAIVVYQSLLSKSTVIILLIVMLSLIVCLMSIQYQRVYVALISERLYYPIGMWWDWWKSIHLNSLYYNAYTFTIGVFISSMVGGVVAYLHRTK
jgi:Flp pilus assembly protein TadB